MSLFLQTDLITCGDCSSLPDGAGRNFFILFYFFFLSDLLNLQIPSDQIPHSLTFSLTPVQAATLVLVVESFLLFDTQKKVTFVKPRNRHCFCSGVEGGVHLLPFSHFSVYPSRRPTQERKRERGGGGCPVYSPHWLAGWLAVSVAPVSQ